MPTRSLLKALSLYTSLSQTLALGINCRGSTACVSAAPQPGGGFGNDIPALVNYISGIDETRVFKQGEHIACIAYHNPFIAASTKGGVCVFLQTLPAGINGLDGGKIKTLLGDIQEHQCTNCGSVPIDFPTTNDVANGQLTVNYVSNTDNECDTGLCPGAGIKMKKRSPRDFET